MDTTTVTVFKSRIAPTPSGFLHIGNLYSFLLTWLWTKLNNGKLLLRIDDMDGERCRDEYLQDIFETLQFVDIDYDEGPTDVHDFKQHFTQHKRLENYYAAIEKLQSLESLYACICSRKDMQSNLNMVDPLHCKEKKLPFNTPNSALRINVQNNPSVAFNDYLQGELTVNLPSVIPDFVVRQKNGLPSYQICSLVDDLLFGITHIVRGEDLLPSTAAQLHLAKTLDEVSKPYPPTGNKHLKEALLEKTGIFRQIRFLHHPLIKGWNGDKLSKSAGDTSIKLMRSNGFTLKQILAQLINMFGIKNCEPNNIQELLQFIIANDGKEIGIFASLKPGNR